jgi:hypothetical protein
VRQAADFLPLEQLTIMHLKTGEWELFGAMIGSGAGGSSAARPSRGLKARLFFGAAPIMARFDGDQNNFHCDL